MNDDREKGDNMTGADTLELFAMSAAIEAFISGEAMVSKDGSEVRWPEPACDPKLDRLVGISRCDGRWAPLIECGQE
jgi:hypothetical protein